LYKCRVLSSYQYASGSDNERVMIYKVKGGNLPSLRRYRFTSQRADFRLVPTYKQRVVQDPPSRRLWLLLGRRGEEICHGFTCIEM